MGRDQTTDIIVIGGGVIGCFIADELASEGIRVTVIEQGQIGAEASSASAGLLVPLHAADEEGVGSPITAVKVKEIIIDSRENPDLAPFSPARFVDKDS